MENVILSFSISAVLITAVMYAAKLFLDQDAPEWYGISIFVIVLVAFLSSGMIFLVLLFQWIEIF